MERKIRLYEFSNESVEKAKAAALLGFDIIGKDLIPIMHGHHNKIRVFMANTHTQCELDSNFFPEIDPDTRIDIGYIINHKDINAAYEKSGIRYEIKKINLEEEKGNV